MKKILVLFFFLAWLSSAPAQTDFYTHPEWSKNANIYEVNIRQYTPEGTFKTFEKSLPRLKEMGVDILWIMPIYPIGEVERKGTLGSYYAVKDYRKVNPEFGTLDDFKELVKNAHSMGFKVILDWVANHSAPDNFLTKEHPDWYKHDSTGKIIPPVADWSDVSGFNYKNKALWDYQIESMKYWLKEADVDGFRCDVAMMVPLEFWKQVRTELDKTKKVFMLAEAEGPEFNRNGFDMTYGWSLLNLMNQIAKGEKKAADITALIRTTDSAYSANDYHMYFTTNHDENSWNGTEYERMGDGAKCFEVLCFTLPGMPLIYGGQESAVNKRLRFFDKDTINWNNYPLQNFYKTLLSLKHNNPELWNGSYGGKMEIIKTGNPNVFAFTRTLGAKQIFVWMNLSNTVVLAEFKPKEISGNYKEVFTGKESKDWDNYMVEHGPWEYDVWVKE